MERCAAEEGGRQAGGRALHADAAPPVEQEVEHSAALKALGVQQGLGLQVHAVAAALFPAAEVKVAWLGEA